MIQATSKNKQRKPPSPEEAERLGKLYITLFADASHCPRTLAYGWGYWIKYGFPAQRIIDSAGGVGLKDSNAAELEGLRQGIAKIKTLDFKGKIIVAQCDNLYAINALHVELNELVRLGASKAYGKHVKGHQGTGVPRSAVNTTCDRLAGQSMRWHRAAFDEVPNDHR